MKKVIAWYMETHLKKTCWDFQLLFSFLYSKVEQGVTRRYRSAMPINTCSWNCVSRNSSRIKAGPSQHAHPTHYTLHRRTASSSRPEGVRHTDHTLS